VVVYCHLFIRLWPNHCSGAESITAARWGECSAQPAPIQPPSYPSTSPGASTSQFEQPSVVGISEFLPVSMQSGRGYSLGQQVPTNRAMGQYTIIANADVFGGEREPTTLKVDLLKIRLSEKPAIAERDRVSTTAVFARAFGSSAAHPVADAGGVRACPLESLRLA